MSHSSNPFNNISGSQQSIPGTFQQFNQTPANQIPGVKQDGNSNSSVPVAGITAGNHYTQSANSSPAFNHPGVLPPSTSLQSSPIRPIKPLVNPNPGPLQNIQNIPQNLVSTQSVSNVTSTPSYYPPNIQHGQINNNAPPLVPSSQYNQPPVNGPLGPATSQRPLNQYAPPSSSFSPTPFSQSYISNPHNVHTTQPLPGGQKQFMPPMSAPNIPFSGPPVSGLRNSPLITGPPTTALPTGLQGQGGPPLGPPRSDAVNGPSIPDLRPLQMGPPRSIPSGPSPSLGQVSGQNYQNGPSGQPIPPNYSTGAFNSGLQNIPSTSGQNMGMPQPQPVPTGPPRTNFQNRYPQMPSSNIQQHAQQQQLQMQQNIAKQFPQSNMYGVTQQMGQLSVTKQGFDQLWGHQMVDLMQCKNILPEYPEDPPEIKLGHQFADAPNCSPEIFRCTVNRIPESNSLLQKSRLPLGILIHPFKDLNHLPVIQCTSIVRCRACRTYINPFVYFVDSKRWKCNLCYRVNDLPEEFQYDPVSKSYGDPSRRPEIRSATIEFIAPSEYMLRPPQPAVYLFLLDVSQFARDSGYLQVVCDTLKENLEQMPGDARMQIGFICYDAHIHYYLMSDGLTKPQEMTVLDIDDIFLPSPESLLVNLGENKDMVNELLTLLPQRYSNPGVPASALGAALQAAYKLMSPTGGRVTVFQTCLPNIGPGALQSREDPNARSAKEVAHLNPATDFYKRLALDCSGVQVAVDLFLLPAHYCDLSTLSGMSKFSAGSVHHIPLFRAQRAWQADLLRGMLTRYLTRKIGFEAVMRVRCTRGISIHTFHGNFFVRSTDLLSLPNVSPDAGFGMQLSIEESLTDLQQVCFQAALLYTSSKGERRIRVHTLALPIANTLPDVLHSADQQAIIGLLSKMAVDRCASASMSEAREALTNVAVDVLSAHRLAQNLPAGQLSAALHAPVSLRLLPLYIIALLKRKAFRTGTSTRLDERVADMCLMKCAPLPQLVRAVYPDLYALNRLAETQGDPPRMHLSAERINSNGAYLMDDGETMMIYVCHGVSPALLSDMFGVAAFSQLPDDARSLPQVRSDGNELLHAFVDKLNEDRPYPSNIVILRDNSPSKQMFTERLVDDRVESAFSYYEFLQHIKNQVK